MNNGLVILRNKKLNIDFDKLSEICDIFSASGYYFDKTSLVAFDNPQKISTQLRDLSENFDNGVIVCSQAQIKMVADYLGKCCSSTFDYGNMMVVGDKTFYIIDAQSDYKTLCNRFVERLNEKYKVSYDKFFIKTVCAPKELINEAIKRASELGGDIFFVVNDNFGDQAIEVSYSSTTPKMTADAVLRTFATLLDGYIYALDNVSLAQRLFELLSLRRMKISVSESFTGGGICKRLVDVSGISEVFYEGLNTYSNESKMSRLGVQELTLKQYGAVSKQTAYEMALGLINTQQCDVSIATTGIAGPKSDNTNKPVGLAYIGIGLKDGVSVYEFNFKGNRNEITQTAINQALFLAYKTIK